MNWEAFWRSLSDYHATKALKLEAENQTLRKIIRAGIELFGLALFLAVALVWLGVCAGAI